MKDSIINDDQTYDELGNDISCNLGSTNITNLMASPNFGKSVRVMARALSQVSDDSKIDVVPSVRKGNDMYHSYGLGAMDLHGFLAKNKIHYGSPESLEFVEVYFMLLNYWTLYESNQIAIERKETFFEFEKSEYANGEYFDKYLSKIDGYNHVYTRETGEFVFEHEKIRELFKDIGVPSLIDWHYLQKNVEEHGIYNALTSSALLS